jgi:hypothetical protein
LWKNRVWRQTIFFIMCNFNDLGMNIYWEKKYGALPFGQPS